MLWWMWILLGLVLLALEAATPGGFFALFFGLSGIVVGILVRLGWAGPDSVQWLLFSFLSLVALATLRRPLQARLNMNAGGRKPVDTFLGEEAVVVEEIPANGVGKVELRGASWRARSSMGAALVLGQRCQVEKVEGLTLWVLPE